MSAKSRPHVNEIACTKDQHNCGALLQGAPGEDCGEEALGSDAIASAAAVRKRKW